jgi:hypothetical protein
MNKIKELCDERSWYSTYSKKAVLIDKIKKIYLAATDATHQEVYKNYLLVDGQKFYEKDVERISRDCSYIALEKNHFGYELFYKGEMYNVNGIHAHKMDEVYEARDLFSDMGWSDVTTDLNDDDKENLGYCHLIRGHSRRIYRKISKKELLMTHHEIKKIFYKKERRWTNDDFNLWVHDICKFLMISESAYRLGNYDLNACIIKRLNKKITYKQEKINRERQWNLKYKH